MIPLVSAPVGPQSVSVVIPTRGRPELLQAIESALSQTMPPREIIIVEDGPDLIDKATLKRLGAYRGFVRVISCPEASGGPARPRNIGTTAAISPLVAFLDDDDWWREGKLASQVHFMNQRGLVACGSNAFVWTEDRIDGSYFINQMPETRMRDFFRHNPLITSTVVCSRNALMSVGGFPEEPDYIGFEDYLAWMKLSAVGRIANSPEVTAYYRKVSSTSLSGQLSGKSVDAVAEARRYTRRFARRSALIYARAWKAQLETVLPFRRHD
jgi:glycosyltransferase involved in cell wall biosynthesis